MSKGVHTTLWVIVHVTQHTIYHTRCTSSSSYLTRIQHVQRQCVVRLVTTSICNRSTGLQSHLCSSLSTYHALLSKCRNDISYQRTVKSIVIHQEVSHLVVLEIPEHSLRQTADGSVSHTTQSHGDIVTRQHYLIYFTIQFWLIFLYPSQLGCSKVTWRVQQMTQTLVSAQVLESLLTIRHSTRVTPDDCRAQSLQILIHTYQTVHLVRDTDSLNLLSCSTTLLHNLLQTQFGVIPPHLRILLSPTSLDSHDWSLLFRIECCCYTLAAIGVNQ